MSDRRHLATTTTAAIAVILVITVAFLAYAGQEIASVRTGDRLGTEEVVLGLNQETADNATWLVAGLILAVCALTLSMAIGLARRKPGSRYAAITLFALMGVVALGASVAGATSTPPARNAFVGLLCGAVDLVVVGLLLARSTAVDFDQAEVDRQRRLARG